MGGPIDSWLVRSTGDSQDLRPAPEVGRGGSFVGLSPSPVGSALRVVGVRIEVNCRTPNQCRKIAWCGKLLTPPPDLWAQKCSVRIVSFS